MPSKMRRILLIGVGGVGNQIVGKTLINFRRRLGDETQLACYGFDLEPAESHTVYNDMVVDSASRIVNRLWEHDERFRQWWPRNPRTLKPYAYYGGISSQTAAGQIRPNGRLVGVRHISEIRDAVRNFFQQQAVVDVAHRAEGKREPFVVFIIGTLGGGTGSGLLHEVAFACRELIQQDDFLIGLFLDGTVVKSWAPASTGAMAYAALTEIEHWMCHAGDYYETPVTESVVQQWRSILEQNGGSEGVTKNGYFDIVFLVQRENENRGLLGGRRTGNIKTDYIELVAGALYALLVGDLMSDPSSRFFENPPFLYFRGEKRIKNNRCFKYGSFGTCLLTVPVKKIAEYLAASQIVDVLEKRSLDEETLPISREYLSQRNLDQCLGQVSHRCRQAKNFHKLEGRISQAINSVSKAKNREILLKRAAQWQINSPEVGWEPWFVNYENECEELLAKLVQEELHRLDEHLFNVLSSVHPDSIIKWLGDIDKRIGTCKEKIMVSSPENEVQESRIPSWTNKATQTFKKVRDASWLTATLRFGELRSDIVGTLEEMRQEAQRREKRPMANFYDTLSAGIKRRTECLKAISGALLEIEYYYRSIRSTFTSRTNIIDSDKLQSNEHPLELEVGTHPSFIHAAEALLRGKVKESDIRNALAQPKDFVEEKIRWEGLPTFYRRCIEEYERYLAGTGVFFDMRRMQTEFHQIIGVVLEQLIINKVHYLLAERFTLWEALSSFLEEKYKEAKAYDQKSPQARDQLTDFQVHFGDEGAANLLDAGNRKVEQWQDEALAYMVKRLTTFSAPFWQLHEFERGQCKNEDDIEHDNLRIYVPQEEISTRLNQQEIFRNIASKSRDIICGMKDKHMLAIVDVRVGYPLYSLRSLDTDRRLYLEHTEKWERGDETTPQHVDDRFYNIWRDDILQREAHDQKQQDLIIRAYLLALGTHVLKRTQTKGFALDGKTLANSLPKLVVKLRANRGALHKLVELTLVQVSDSLHAASRDKKEAQETIWSVLLRGREIHDSIRPPKTATSESTISAYEIWQLIAEVGIIRRLPDGTWNLQGRLIPKTASDFKLLLDCLTESVPKK